MGAVGSAECVIYEEVCVICKLLGEHRVVLLFLGVETRVLEKHHIAVLHLRNRRTDRYTWQTKGNNSWRFKLSTGLQNRKQWTKESLTDAVRHQFHFRPLQQLGQARGHGSEGELLLEAAFRATKV